MEDLAWKDALFPEDGLSSFDGLISRLGLAPDGARLADGGTQGSGGPLTSNGRLTSDAGLTTDVGRTSDGGLTSDVGPTSDGGLTSNGGPDAGRSPEPRVDAPLASKQGDAKDPLADAIAEHVQEGFGHGAASGAMLLAHGVDALFDSGLAGKQGARGSRAAPAPERAKAKGLESSAGVDGRAVGRSRSAAGKRPARSAAGAGGKPRTRERGFLE